MTQSKKQPSKSFLDEETKEFEKQEGVHEDLNREPAPHVATRTAPSADGWEDVGDITPFWDFKNKKTMQGILQGEGKTINEGETSETKTYIFDTPDGRFLVPQWAMLNELQQVEAGAYEYQITYLNLVERPGKGKFHSLQVRRRQVKK